MTEERRLVALLAPGPLLEESARAVAGYDFVTVPQPAALANYSDLAGVLEAHGASDCHGLIIGDGIFPAGDPDSSLTRGNRFAFLAVKAIIRGMMRRRAGRILACAPGPGGPAPMYAAVDSLSGFMKSVAREVGSRAITANVIAFGPMSVVDESVSPYVALGRGLESTDAVGVLGFLLSDASGYLSGQTVWLDGGLGLG